MIGELLEALRHFERMGAAFQRTGTGDQCERQRIAEARLPDGDDGVGGGLDCHGGPRLSRPMARGPNFARLFSNHYSELRVQRTLES